MRVVIIGAGVSGLATYQYLRKVLPNPPAPNSPHTIQIYESHRPRVTGNSSGASDDVGLTSFETLSASTAVVGGGLGVSPNGMRVLRDLDPEIHKAVMDQGFPCEHFIFMGQNGWTLGKTKTTDKGGFEGPEGQAEVCVSSTRHGLWACLMAKMPPGTVHYKKVSQIQRGVEGALAVLFDDGSKEECDLVIGADGVKSVVRKALFGEDEVYAPKYTYVSSSPFHPSFFSSRKVSNGPVVKAELRGLAVSSKAPSLLVW